MKTYTNILNKIEKLLFWFIVILFVAMLGLMSWQIVLRYLFNSSSIWIEELVRFMFVWLTLTASSIAIRKNRHLKVSFLIDLLSEKKRTILEIVSYTVILTFLVYLAFLSTELIQNTFVNKSAGLRVPMAIPYSGILFGTVLMILTTVEFLLLRISSFKKENPDMKKGV